MPLTIYGSPRSRTMRVLWMAEELGLDYEHVPYEANDPVLKSEAFLALNPAGAIPTVVDDGHALSESLAINMYLAKKHSHGGSGLYAACPEEESAIWQWTLWVQGHLEPWVQQEALPATLMQSIATHAPSMIRKALVTLSIALRSTPWLVGRRFTVADANVAGVLSPSRSSAIDMTAFPDVAGWLGRCYARPAAVRARTRYARA